MSIVSNWTTHEILQFLNSYHQNKPVTTKNINIEALNDLLLKELCKRSDLLALPYTVKTED